MSVLFPQGAGLFAHWGVVLQGSLFRWGVPRLTDTFCHLDFVTRLLHEQPVGAQTPGPQGQQVPQDNL